MAFIAEIGIAFDNWSAFQLIF